MEIITIDGIDFSVGYGTVYAVFTGGDLIGEGKLIMHSKDSVDQFIRWPDKSNFYTAIWPKLKEELLKRLRNRLNMT